MLKHRMGECTVTFVFRPTLSRCTHPLYAPSPLIVGNPVCLVLFWRAAREAWVYMSTISRFWLRPPYNEISPKPQSQPIGWVKGSAVLDTPEDISFPIWAHQTVRDGLDIHRMGFIQYIIKNMIQKVNSQRAKNHGTQDSRVVPHRGTNWAALRLTAQIGRDAVLSKSYGRGYNLYAIKPFVWHLKSAVSNKLHWLR